ncbi:IFN protein, partial [Crotophaga sulcirostris]|nr:IFN protein [Crotophaga sulcirostris]
MPAFDNQQTGLRHSSPLLLLLLMALSTTLACQRPPDDTLPWNSLQLLETMAPSPTEPCQHQQPSFFPKVLRHNHHSQQAAFTALRILQNLFHTLSSNRIPQHWDAQAHHNLLNRLQDYIQHLQQCLPAHRMLFKRHGPRNLMLNINKYFRRIHDFLRIHNHSACAWEHVCLEARQCFKHVDTLIRQIK